MDKQAVIQNNQRSTVKFSAFRKTAARYLTSLLVRLIAKTSITPNAITWFGFIVSLGAAALILTDNLFVAGFVVLAGGFFDMLDGALARSTERVTKFGGVLDSTLDRLAEAAVLIGIMMVFTRMQSEIGVLLTSLALLSSIMVSYLRAKAEILGLNSELGIFTRPERVIVLALGLLLNGFENALIIAISMVVFFSFITAGQRLVNIWRLTK